MPGGIPIGAPRPSCIPIGGPMGGRMPGGGPIIPAAEGDVSTRVNLNRHAARRQPCDSELSVILLPLERTHHQSQKHWCHHSCRISTAIRNTQQEIERLTRRRCSSAHRRRSAPARRILRGSSGYTGTHSGSRDRASPLRGHDLRPRERPCFIQENDRPVYIQMA